MLSYVNKDMNVMVESKVYRTKAFMGMKSWVNFLVMCNNFLPTHKIKINYPKIIVKSYYLFQFYLDICNDT